jgi:hypothetical protein
MDWDKINKEMENNLALSLGTVMRSAKVDIIDSDIATIEALHDLLIDKHGYSIDHKTLKNARLLTEKMYKALK